MSEFTGVLLAGGIGSRSGQELPKQFALLRGKPMIVYGIELLASNELITEIVITFPEGYESRTKEIIETYLNDVHKKRIKVVRGGISRQESVYLALLECTNDFVVIHEAARPLAKQKLLDSLLGCPSDSATLVFSVPFTVLTKKFGFISGVLDRDELVNIQLPQKFPRARLLEYHVKAREESRSFTDDSSLFFTYGGDVAVVLGSSENVKITDWKDFLVAEAILGDRYE